MTDFHGLVLVLGATGPTGYRVVASLAAKQIRVRAMVRNAEKAAGIPALQLPGVEVFVGQVLDDADLKRAFEGVTAVISALGNNLGPQNTANSEAVDYTAMVKAAQAAKIAGVQQFVICSSMGTETPERIPFLTEVLRIKRRGEIALEQSGVPYTIVRPGGLVNDPGGQDVVAARTLTTGGRITRDDVAEVLVQAILQPAARNKIVEILNQPGAGPATRPDLFK